MTSLFLFLVVSAILIASPLIIIDSYSSVTINSSDEIKRTASDAAVGLAFGSAIAILDDTIVVGNSAGTGNEIGSGVAYIFSRNQGGADNWGELKKILASDGVGSDLFGTSVAISGDTLVVGAHENSNPGPEGPGMAYIFERNLGGADNWGERTKITASDGLGDDTFGRSVAIVGDTVFVSAQDDHVSASSGSVYIFERNLGGANNWGEVKKILALDGVGSDGFGFRMVVSGDTLIVGASNGDGNEDNSGSAYIFQQNQGGANNWGKVKKIIASDGVAFYGFGDSVSISGDIVIIGSADDDDIGFNFGSSYIFSRNQGGADNWGQVKKITASDPATNDRFGFSVSISGDTVLVGAAGVDSSTGSAYISEQNKGGANNWGEVKKITASDGVSGDNFGARVAISGDTVLVGAQGDDSFTGAIYIFSENNCVLPLSGPWTIISSCVISSSDMAPGNVIVQSPAVLTIKENANLDIDFTQFSLTVQSGSGVLIKSGGKIT